MHFIYENLGIWVATTIVALLTIFSDKILGRIRFSLNKADSRAKYFEEMAERLSTFVYWAELFYEGFATNRYENEEYYAGLSGSIDVAVTELLTREYVYRSWMKSYWSKEQFTKYNKVITAVKKVEAERHLLLDKMTVVNLKSDEVRRKGSITFGKELKDLHVLTEKLLTKDIL
jgi:hypothetical protein